LVKVGVQQAVVKKEVLGERSAWSPELSVGDADDEID
jgi:hypothetical protein